MTTYESDNVKLYLGDCLDILPAITGQVNAVITDPPWGGNYDCDYTRFTNGITQHRNHHRGCPGDDKPFDPLPWLNFPAVVLWGYQHFADRLPIGSILVWNKKRDSQLGTFLSDCEIAWMKGGHGCYLFNHVWHGFDRETERGKVMHPMQKPVALMAWCLERAGVPIGATVLDPFMGSGATGIACIQTGRKFIGMEIDSEYFEIARRRIQNYESGAVINRDAPNTAQQEEKAEQICLF